MGKQWKQWQIIFLGSEITTDGDCSHEIKRHLLLVRKLMMNLDSILEKAMASDSSTLAWKIQWTEEPGRLQSMESQRIRHNWATLLSRIGEGNGNPLQCSCLESPRNGGAWWSAVYGVEQSGTWLKWLSNCRQHIKKQRQYFANRDPSSQSSDFSSSLVWVWELDFK